MAARAPASRARTIEELRMTAGITRSRRRLTTCLIGIMGFAGVATLAGCSGLLPQSYGFTATELQARLAQRMPYRKTLGVFEIELNQPQLTLDAGANRMATAFAATLRSPFRKPAIGVFSISGVPRYEGSTRSIMLGATRVDALQFDGVPRELTSLIREIANGLVADLPLHTFKAEELRVGAIELNPQAIRMTPDRLIVDLAPR